MAAKRFLGKVCVVTGSTYGIGLETAKRFGLEGAKVVVSSRQQSNVDKAVDNLKSLNIDVIGRVCHVADAKQRMQLFDEAASKFGGIDILVSNAAANPAKSAELLDTSEEKWDKIFDVNVKSSFLLTKEVKPFMVNRGGGSIVYISSVIGYQVNSNFGAYSVSKTALFGLTKAAAVGCAKDNIRVNCVAPGIIETKFSKAVSFEVKKIK